MIDLDVFLIISIVIPNSIMAILIVKYKVDWKVVIIGFLTFLVSQVFFRLPIFHFLETIDPSIGMNFWFKLQAPFTAGIVEVGADYMAFRWFLNKCKTSDAIVLGLAHGICENIYIGIVMPLLLIGSLGNMNSAIMKIGSFERVFAIIAHIAFGLFAYYAVQKKKIRFLVYGILLHALDDLACIFVKGIWNLEISCAIISVVSLIIIVLILLRKENSNKMIEGLI